MNNNFLFIHTLTILKCHYTCGLNRTGTLHSYDIVATNSFCRNYTGIFPNLQPDSCSLDICLSSVHTLLHMQLSFGPTEWHSSISAYRTRSSALSIDVANVQNVLYYFFQKKLIVQGHPPILSLSKR